MKIKQKKYLQNFPKIPAMIVWLAFKLFPLTAVLLQVAIWFASKVEFIVLLCQP